MRGASRDSLRVAARGKSDRFTGRIIMDARPQAALVTEKFLVKYRCDRGVHHG
jgi:hypothetical protein